MRLNLLILLVFFLSSCEKEIDPILDDVPSCISTKIEEFKKASDSCNQKGPNVIEYQFQDELVYAFDMGQCISDGSTTVYDKDCEEICILGTIVGITDCRDEPFSNAVEVRVLWQQ